MLWRRPPFRRRTGGAANLRVIGLTGSVGMGKSTAAVMLRRLGVPVQDADAVVHRLLARGGVAVAEVAALFPETLREGAVDRGVLRDRVFGDPAALRRLEGVLHPLVEAERRRFLALCARRRARLAVLEVPLLLEIGLDRACDLVVVATAPLFVQQARVLRRPGMTLKRLAAVQARQLPEAEKCRRADVLLRTGAGKRPVWRRLRRLWADRPQRLR